MSHCEKCSGYSHKEEAPTFKCGEYIMYFCIYKLKKTTQPDFQLQSFGWGLLGKMWECLFLCAVHRVSLQFFPYNSVNFIDFTCTNACTREHARTHEHTHTQCQ
jgi:hypothetical protein